MRRADRWVFTQSLTDIFFLGMKVCKRHLHVRWSNGAAGATAARAGERGWSKVAGCGRAKDAMHWRLDERTGRERETPGYWANGDNR